MTGLDSNCSHWCFTFIHLQHTRVSLTRVCAEACILYWPSLLHQTLAFVMVCHTGWLSHNAPVQMAVQRLILLVCMFVVLYFYPRRHTTSLLQASLAAPEYQGRSDLKRCCTIMFNLPSLRVLFLWVSTPYLAVPAAQSMAPLCCKPQVWFRHHTHTGPIGYWRPPITALICFQCTVRDHVKSSIDLTMATDHRLKRTLVNPLAVPRI